MDADAPQKPNSIFAIIKMARNLTSFKQLNGTASFNPNDTKFQAVVRKVMGANALVNCLKSLDRRQMLLASTHFSNRCRSNPKGTLILQDAGCLPVLVDLLGLEGMKNSEIVSNCLFSLSIMTLEIQPCLELAQISNLPSRLEHLYRSDSGKFRRLSAGIICRVFNQLGNVGMETELVRGFKSKRSSTVFEDTKKGGRSSMTELLISLLSSGEKRIVKNALFTIETLSYHFDNVVALCEVGEEMLKGEIIELLKSNDIEIVMMASQVVNGIVSNGRLHPSTLKFSQSTSLLGQLRTTMDFIANEDGEFPTFLEIAKDNLSGAMFDMYTCLGKDRKRFHGPESRREEALLKEANR
ncbi:hypothetical protein TrLO_g1675 [Triparma laevis f. longispina]|uniref:Uncharacterized protein n=1 Tax=Triparma laevis f. longispina TaxID=1714387 RepID=A0A9W7ANP8_9STRA|nr:hypothetical protein TrLO_g1675 [Triparma laevis f. longispina]